MVNNVDDIISAPGINYGKEFSEFINIPYSGTYQVIHNIKPDFKKRLIDEDDKFNFDLFVAVFYFLARVEEYEETEKDEHGRYRSSNSSLAASNILDIPIVDLWIAELKGYIEKKWRINISYNREYTFSSTIDVDHIYAYKNKPLGIQLGGLTKDVLSLSFGRIKDRFSINDPYDRLEDMIAWHRNNGSDVQFFVLTAKRTNRDKNLDPESLDFQKKISQIAKNNKLGIHPSYYAEEKKSICAEKDRLASITGVSIKSSRQHYLRLQIPSMYRALINCGIEEDHTMGYPDVIGFRAGTSYPFYWYDLEQDEVSNLRIIPFQVMDVTMKQYLGLSPEEGLERTKQIIDMIKPMKGNFGLIWHNSSFYAREGWSGWESVYKSILEYAKP